LQHAGDWLLLDDAHSVTIAIHFSLNSPITLMYPDHIDWVFVNLLHE